MCNLYCTWNKQSKLKEYLDYILKNNVVPNNIYLIYHSVDSSKTLFNLLCQTNINAFLAKACVNLGQLRNRQIGRDEGGLFLTSNHEFESEMFRPCIVDWYIMHLRRIVIDAHKFVAIPYDCIDVARFDVSNQVLNTLWSCQYLCISQCCF